MSREYLLRRLLGTIPLLVGVTLLVFVLFHCLGGDPALMLAGKHATIERLQEIRVELGLDRPLWVQYFSFLKETLTLDFGRSFTTRQSISAMLSAGIGPSLTLAVPAFVLSTLFSLALGLCAAYWRGRWLDRAIVTLGVLGMSAPALALILFGQYVLAYKLGWFPIFGYEYGLPQSLGFVALPALIWVLLSVGPDTRYYRTAFLQECLQDYVRTARAKGLSEPVIFAKHVFFNSMIPILTNTVAEIPFLILGSFLLESFFGIPGVGGMTVEAIHNSDFPVLKAMTVLGALLMVIGNLATDLLYRRFDPRVELR